MTRSQTFFCFSFDVCFKAAFWLTFAKPSMCVSVGEQRKWKYVQCVSLIYSMNIFSFVVFFLLVNKTETQWRETNEFSRVHKNTSCGVLDTMSKMVYQLRQLLFIFKLIKDLPSTGKQERQEKNPEWENFQVFSTKI